MTDQGPVGLTGLMGPQGPAGTVGFGAAKASVVVHPNARVKLPFLVVNRTAGAITAKLKAKVPGALHVTGPKSVKVKALGTGARKKVSFKLNVGANTQPGSYKVKVTFSIGAAHVTRTITVRVIPN